MNVVLFYDVLYHMLYLLLAGNGYDNETRDTFKSSNIYNIPTRAKTKKKFEFIKSTT